MKKLALFDFCETLVSFQTAGRFVDFVRAKLGSRRMLKLEELRVKSKALRFTAVANKLLPHYNFDKRLHLYQLKGLSKQKLDDLARQYYQEVIAPNLIPEMIDHLKEKLKEGFTVSIVSGGYSIYLNYFAEQYGISDVIASEIGFDKHGICTGRIKGSDCMYHYKIEKLSNHFVATLIDLKESIAYSDSITDLPLLRWTGKGVVVSSEKSQAWAKDNGLSEIVFEKQASPVF
jgi:HAD superfamily hydrolase (TIGR01490 family)